MIVSQDQTRWMKTKWWQHNRKDSRCRLCDIPSGLLRSPCYLLKQIPICYQCPFHPSSLVIKPHNYSWYKATWNLKTATTKKIQKRFQLALQLYSHLTKFWPTGCCEHKCCVQHLENMLWKIGMTFFAPFCRLECRHDSRSLSS